MANFEVEMPPGFEDVEPEIRVVTGLYMGTLGFSTNRILGTSGVNTKRCEYASWVDICGISATGGEGIVEFKLRDFFCVPGGPQEDIEDEKPDRGELGTKLIAPFIFLATPRSDSPAYLTSLVTLQSNERNALVKVFSWLPGGTSAGNVSFSWHCRFQTRSQGTLSDPSAPMPGSLEQSCRPRTLC